MIATYIDVSQVHERNEEIGREVLANRLAKRLRNDRTHRLNTSPRRRAKSPTAPDRDRDIRRNLVLVSRELRTALEVAFGTIAGHLSIHTGKEDDPMRNSLLGKVAREHHRELVREADRRRISQKPDQAHRPDPASSLDAITTQPAVRNIGIRWGSYKDETRVRELLDLNGIPRVAAFGEQFLVAEEDGGVLAAVGYRTASKRMILGNVIADPWAGESELAVALYAGARSLAQEIGVREVRVGSTGRTNYPREAGYRRHMGEWYLDLRSQYGVAGRPETSSHLAS